MPTVFTSGSPPNEVWVALVQCTPYALLASTAIGAVAACSNPRRRNRTITLVVVTALIGFVPAIVCGVQTWGLLRLGIGLNIYSLINILLPSVPYWLASLAIWRVVRHSHDNAA